MMRVSSSGRSPRSEREKRARRRVRARARAAPRARAAGPGRPARDPPPRGRAPRARSGARAAGPAARAAARARRRPSSRPGARRRRPAAPRRPPRARPRRPSPAACRTPSRVGRSVSMARSSAMVRSAPSRSALFTTWMSAISSTPALMACTSSPRPGTLTTTTVSAAPAISTSSCPTPTVSTKMGSRPAASMQVDGVGGGAGEAAERAARGHAADEYAGVEREVVHADAVAQDGAARVGRRRIHGEDADGASALARGAGERADERALAAARRAGDADDVGAPGLGIEPLGERLAPGSPPASAQVRPRASAAHVSRRAMSASRERRGRSFIGRGRRLWPTRLR